MMKRYVSICLILLIPFSLLSQGQSPNDIKWMEINTDHAQIIFPDEISDQAIKAANIIDVLYHANTKTLKSKPKKVPVILYNQYTISNGFAGLRPRRSVWFSSPSQFSTDLGTTDWYYLLGVHEYRHIVQQAAINKNFTKFLSVVFGQTGQLMGRYSIPYWFAEGDAICTETALSHGGRGRIPQFEMPFRTMLLNEQIMNYDKAKFGSYKHFVPNFYNLGYVLTSQARVSIGPDIWDKTINHTSKISFWPYAFSRALKKHSGFNEKQLYNKMMKELKEKWSSEFSKIETRDVDIINLAGKDSWTRYTEVNYIDENTFLAKKVSLKSDITAFYTIDRNGIETKIKATDAGLISASGSKVVWSRTIPDLRWQVRSYSDVILFDIYANEEKRLTRKQKYFAPAISHDGSKIAVIEYDTKMHSKLIILDSNTGDILKSFDNSENDYLRTPSWNSEDNKIVYTNSNETGTALSILNIETNDVDTIIDYTDENIGRPVFWKNYILYNSPYNGIGNIYAVDINTKQRYQITSVKFGAYNPKVYKNKLTFINYSLEGYDIAEIDLSEENFIPIETIKKYRFTTAETLQKQEQGKVVLHPDFIPNKQYEIKKYKRLRHAFNIHSWGISTEYPSSYVLDDLANFRPEVGFNIYTANMLNTVYSSINIGYDLNEETFSSGISVIFSKYYPEISVSGGWYERYRTTELGVDDWIEWKAETGINIPLNFSRGIYFRGADIGVKYSFTKIDDKLRSARYTSEFTGGEHHSIRYTASAFNFRKQANQDINPKYGQFVYITYSDIPGDQTYEGFQLSAYTSLYFPSLFKHHSINLRAGYEKQRDVYDQDIYLFSTPQSFARGYNFPANDELYSLKLNYSMPIWYPDLNIGPFIYFKRLRGNLFYDLASFNVLGYSHWVNQQSAGLELFIETYLLRLGEPIEIGSRVSYLFNPSENENQFVTEFLVLGIPF